MKKTIEYEKLKTSTLDKNDILSDIKCEIPKPRFDIGEEVIFYKGSKFFGGIVTHCEKELTSLVNIFEDFGLWRYRIKNIVCYDSWVNEKFITSTIEHNKIISNFRT